MASTILRDEGEGSCPITEAREMFSESMNAARKMDSEKLVREIAVLINRIGERDSVMNFVLKATYDLADEEETINVLRMALEYEDKTRMCFYDLAGFMLQALERNKLVEVTNA